MEINVKEYLGNNINVEDAIVLRETVKKHMNEGVTLNFEGIDTVPATFFNCLFGDNLYCGNREEIFNEINVKNLTNENDYTRVVLGTAFLN